MIAVIVMMLRVRIMGIHSIWPSLVLNRRPAAAGRPDIARVASILIPERRLDLAFLLLGEPPVHDEQDRQHHARHQGGPLQEKSDQHKDEAHVLRMSHVGVGPGRGKGAGALSLVQHSPAGGDQPESGTDQDIAQQVEWIAVGISGPARKVRARYGPRRGAGGPARKAIAQPARQQVERQRETVHLHEQRDDEGREGTKRAPVAGRRRLEEAQGEQDEDAGVHQGQEPEPIGRRVTDHRDRPPCDGHRARHDRYDRHDRGA